MLAEPPDSPAKAALAEWDFVMDKASVAATIYLHFERRVSEAMRELVIPEAVRGLLRGVNKKRMFDHLMAPDGRFGENPIDTRDDLLLQAFADGVQDVTERLGADMADWQYGQNAMKYVHITNYMAQAVNEETRQLLEVGPYPRGGYESTVHNTSGNDNQRSGGSFRVILDPSNWDNSIATSTPGQSGDPMNPPLPRPLRTLGPPPVLPARLHAGEGGVGHRTPSAVEPVGSERRPVFPVGASDRFRGRRPRNRASPTGEKCGDGLEPRPPVGTAARQRRETA